MADEQGDVVVGKLEEELQVSKDEEGLSKEIGPGLGEKGVDEVDWSVKTIPNKELLTTKSNCRYCVYGTYVCCVIVVLTLACN